MIKEDWLDNVTDESLREYFEKNKGLAKIKELREIKIIPDDEGKKRVFFNYDAYSRTMDRNEIAVFDAFGSIMPYQRQYDRARKIQDGDITSDEDLLNWYLMVSQANRGRKINGMTYDEAFIEYYQGIINKLYNQVISDKQTELVAYINKKIRLGAKLRNMVESNASNLADDTEMAD